MTRIPSPSASPAASASRLASRASAPSSVAKPLQRHVLASVHDELRRAAKDLDELCAELSLRCRTSTARPATEQPSNGGNADPSHEQARDKHEGGGREDRRGNADRYRARQHGHGRWSEPAKVEALQRVDVADHAAHEISAAIRLEPSRGERLDPLEEPNANTSEHAKGEVVRCEPLEVARKRPSEAEEAHGHDHSGEGEDRRVFGGSRDQVSSRCHEADAENNGGGAEDERKQEPGARRPGKVDDPRQRARHGAPTASRSSMTFPASRRMIRSARVASSGL